MQSTIYPGDSMRTILFKACVALGGDARVGDNVIDLCLKILALSGYSMCAPYVTLYNTCETVGGNPKPGDSVYALRKKIAGVLISGGVPVATDGIVTFAGDQIQTFSGDDLVPFS